MTSKLKCPHCGETLRQSQYIEPLTGQNLYFCDTHDCYPTECVIGTQSMWQALIQTKEELKDCQHNYSVKSEQHERGYAYATKIIKDLESKLEIARKALEEIDTTRCIPQQTLISLGKFSKTTRFNAGNIICVATPDYIHNTLEQIEHDNNKD